MFGIKINMNRKVGMQLIEIKAFCGVMGSGKGFKCQQLKDTENYLQIDFADSLREMTWRMLNWKPQTPEDYDKFKKGEIFIYPYGKVDGRLLLQRIGQTFREIDDNFWIKQWRYKVEEAISKGYNKICTSDLRYQNELDMVKSFNWKAKVDVEFCDYHSDRYNADSKHESELFAQRLLGLGYKDGDKVL